MEELYQTQLQLQGAIQQLKINFKKDGQDRKTPENIKRRLQSLELHWQEFSKNDEKLREFRDPAHDYFFKNCYIETQKIYMETRDLIQTSKQPATASAHPVPPSRQPPINQQPGPSNPEQGTSKADQEFTSRGNHSKLDEMLRKQSSNFKALSRTLTNINLDSVEEKWELEDLLKSLDSRWVAIDSLHWEIDSELDGSDEHYENTFTKYENDYATMKKEINSKLWSTSHREQTTPRLDIPIFHGHYQQWVSFKDLFTEAIHRNTCLSNAQKMQFLKSKIKGEPERLIQHLPISSDNYVTCWEILNHRYNNKKLIFTTHINTVMSLPVIQHVASSHIKRLHDVTIESLNGIKNLGVNIETWDPILVHLLTQKLDAETHNEYMSSLKQPRDLPSLKEVLSFLEGKFTAMESSRRKQEAAVSKPSFNPPSTSKNQLKTSCFKQYFTSNKATSSKTSYGYKRKCPVCQNDHGIYFCTEFKEMAPGLKRNTIAKLNLCNNCLYNHNGKPCNSVKRCQECNGCHNTLLHDVFRNQSAPPINAHGSQTRQQGTGSHVAQQNNSDEQTKILLATAMIKVLGADGTPRTMRALIDQGSQICLISENAAQQLGLPRQKCKGVITGVGTKDNICKGMMNLNCLSSNEEYSFNTDAFIMKSLTRNLPNSTFSKPTWDLLDTIPLADPKFYISNSIDLLLGAEVYANIIMEGIHKNNDLPFIAQQTRLGYILSGKVQQRFHCNVVLNNIEDIQKFWAIQDIPENTPYTSEEDECIKFYRSTTTRLPDGRYQVRIPFKDTSLKRLGNSKNKAIMQFRQLENKFIKNAQIAQQYKSFIHEYLTLGHMKPAPIAQQNKTRECYLPHHCVIRNDSITTALRVVFNGSAMTSTGVSLNDLMHKGPNLQKDLLSLILKWRQHRVCFIADLEKMFRQIWMHEEDQGLQKIIWRDSPHEILQEYQLTTVTYGFKAAPFLAMMTLKQLAQDERSNYPEAAQVLEECFYMDDLLHGSHSVESAIKLQQELQQLLQSGGFFLRKWMSNHHGFVQNIGEDTVAKTNYNFKEAESRKTLGLNWDPVQDIFHFHSKIEESPVTEKGTTKRQLLSDISKLFDPVGWLTPVSTKLKLLFQKLWKECSLQWDDKIPNDINVEWIKIKQDLNSNINKYKIPRWLGTDASSEIHLYGFSDATLQTYACTIYCRINIQGQSNIILLAAKSRLVPNNKTMSLPKLELCGAHLLANLMVKVKECLTNHNIKVYGWVDSTAVLGWLQGDPSRWKTFVANRVRQTTEIMPSECWRYVKSAENPADCASRGLTASQLSQHHLWWQGPTWLSTFKPEEQDTATTYTTDEERKNIRVQVNAVVSNETGDSIVDSLINKYSSFTKLVHVMAWVRRFITRKQDRKSEKFLTISELRDAKDMIIKRVQNSEFQDELQDLKRSGTVSSKSNILDLCPFIDEEGILRVKGRLRHAYISYDMKHPIILPHKHRLTELIIDYAHKIVLHGGARTTLNFIRYKYWIIGGNNATKLYIRRCVTCKKQKASLQQQVMGDLPAARSNPSRPFAHTGVDFTGHVFLKTNKGRGIKTTKGYVCVFVCMATKAVHLELVSDLTTSAFIAALRRMSARRGAPLHVYSDQGRNFLGASRILQEQYQEIQHIINEEFMAQISDMEITWHFNAPAWPTAGGLWESAVRAFKFHLKRVIGEQKLTYEEFSTLLAQIEGCLNSRPLCALSEDPNDINYLTPAHFLNSGPTLTLIETEKDLRTRWQLTQKILQDLWKRWRTEYLTQLNTRSKWKKPFPNININDVVIIHDDNLPPGKWTMGRVIELHAGQDQYVRVVTVRTKNGTLKRPVTKLSILSEHKDELPEAKQEHSSPGNNANKDNSPRRPQKTSTNKAKYTLTSTFAALILFLSCLSSGQCDVKIMPFRETQGLYFDKIADMLLIRDEWKLIVYYNMEPYWEATNAFQKYTTFLKNTCETIRTQVHCDIMSLQLRHGFSELEYYNQMLLSQHSITRPALRQRRGLIDGVGYIANSLFGVLDERFAEQYQKDISLLQDNAKHMATLWKNQTSIVEAEYNLLKRTEETMNQQHKMIHQHMNNLEDAFKNLQDKVQTNNIINDFNIGATIASNMLHHLKGIQNVLLDTVTDIYHGRFNLHLLTPEQLINELSTIASTLPRDVSLPIDNLHTDLRKIFDLLKVKTRMMDDFLIFEIRVPLISRDSYELLKIIPIPKKIGSKFMTILPVSDYVSINMKKDTYIPISKYDVDTCATVSDAYFCNIKKPIYQLKDDNSFCMREKSECKTVTATCKNDWQESNALNTYIYFCCEQCQVRTLCADQVTAHQLTNAGLINIGHGCIIKTDNFTIFPHKPHWSEIKIKPELYHPVMAPINHVINISLPNIQEKNESEDLQNETAKLGEKIEKLKKVEITSENISYHDIHHYAMIYVILGGIGAVALCFIIRRVRWRVPPTPSSGAPEPEAGPVPPAPRAHPRTAAAAGTSRHNDSDGSETTNTSRADKATSPNFKVVNFNSL